MTDLEWRMIASEHFDSIFEWGTGGSTCALSELGKRVCTVDSSQAWIDKVKLHANTSLVTFQHVDLGPVKDWGYPVSDTVSGEPYVKAFQPKEAVLIDGRFRVACGLYVLLHCPSECTVFVHDFASRPHYHDLLKFYDIKKQVDSLVALRFKAVWDKNEAERLLRSYYADPR